VLHIGHMERQKVKKKEREVCVTFTFSFFLKAVLKELKGGLPMYDCIILKYILNYLFFC
jgi:hypothetical protein